MTALVTGASGLLGYALAHRLAAKGDDVRVLLRRPEEQAKLFDGTTIECVKGSLEEKDSLRRATESVDEIFHCAATSTDWANWETYYSANVSGVVNILDVAKDFPLKRFLHLSSTDVYGYPRIACDESSPMVKTRLPYNRSKVLGEQAVWSAAKEGLPVTVIRPATIYGPRDQDFVHEIYKFLKKGQWEMPLLAGGNSAGGFLFIDNAVDGIIGAARSAQTIGRAYNLRDETAESWQDFLNAISDEAGCARTRLRLPFWFAYAMGGTLEFAYKLFGWWDSKPLLTRHSVYLMSRDASFPIDAARESFGFRSRVSFKEAITECVKSCKAAPTTSVRGPDSATKNNPTVRQ